MIVSSLYLIAFTSVFLALAVASVNKFKEDFDDNSTLFNGDNKYLDL